MKEANVWECKDIGCKHRGIKEMWPFVAPLEETRVAKAHFKPEEKEF